MRYIIYKRFKDKGIDGNFNLPIGTVCEEINGYIYYQKNKICYFKSENAHQFFSRDNDGNGLIRGKLIQKIQKVLSKKDKQYQERWDKIWTDSICQFFKREEYDDYWLWNHDFFQADIEILKYIANLIGIKEEF